MSKESYDVIIKGGKLKGVVHVPPSKSMSHRALIAAGLSESVSTVRNIALSDDIIATMEAMKMFGATYECISEEQGRYTYRVFRKPQGIDLSYDEMNIYCNESGSTARFLIPFFHLSDVPVVFTGSKGLSERPFKPYLDLFDSKGIGYTANGYGLPLKVYGKLNAGTYEVVGNVSSQFITGLLYMLPLLSGDSVLIVKPPFESRDYVALTIEALDAFGIIIEQRDPWTFFIKGGQVYRGTDYTVEGDYSQAAFWLTAAALGSDIELIGLPAHSKQSDRAIISFIDKSVVCGEQIYDVSECPDLLPILSVLLSQSDLPSEIVGGGRVRIKESDRIKAMTSELVKMGAGVEETPEGLVFRGHSQLLPSQVWSWNDHRIAMALAIAATCVCGEVAITGAECVNKSYPDFWKDYMALGGDLIVKQHG